jgi:hypothetical protein
MNRGTPAIDPQPGPGRSIDGVLETVLSSYQLRVEITTNVRYCGSWY